MLSDFDVAVHSKSSSSSESNSATSDGKQLVRLDRRQGHQRRYAPKTRTGCVTCKIRRVKCDENKPFCKRCTTTGRKCDGYAAPGSFTRPRSPGPLTAALTTDVTSNALERRTFDYFRSRTAPCVSGYFQDSIWDRIVLQLSHREPAVRHAVNALGALHEERSLRKHAGDKGVDVSLLQTGFPLMQYRKALAGMQGLLKDNTNPSDVVLVCSLVCIHFEALRELFVPALMHVENAIQLLQFNTKLDARKANPALVRAIMRTDLQGTMYLASRVPGQCFYTAASDSVLPSSFNELVNARDTVNTWTGHLFHFMRTVADDFKFRNPGDVPLEAFAKAQELEQTFLTLDRLLWELLHKPSASFTTREQHGLSMLRSRVKLNRVLAATCCFSEATIYDKYLTDFDDILTICLYIIGSDNADCQLFSVSLDEGLIHPLFFLCLHCRDGRVRHHALELLEKLPVRDGVWHVQTVQHTAAMCIRFEEALCDKDLPSCEDIPEWRRVHIAEFNGWDDEESAQRKAKVHLRTRPNGMDGEWWDFEGEPDCSVANRQYEDSFGMLFMSAQLHKLKISATTLGTSADPVVIHDNDAPGKISNASNHDVALKICRPHKKKGRIGGRPPAQLI